VRAGSSKIVDDTMAAAAIFVASCSVTATVRSAKFTTCDDVLVVMPVAIVIVQNVFFKRVAVATVTTSVASAAPELLAATVRVVEPQPLAEGVATDPHTKLGSTMVI